ncbi:hypothetical protein P3T22_004688 [Paraburkholderia sp. GAS348]
MLSFPIIDDGAVPHLGNLSILRRQLLRFLLKAMQNVQRFHKLGDIHHAVNAVSLSDANFACSSADRIKRLLVVGVKSCLNLAKLKSGPATWLFGKSE